MNLFPSNFQRLEGAMNAATLTQKTISSNIANVDTPNYKAKEVAFQSELKKAMDSQAHLRAHKTNEQHISFSTEAQQTIQPKIRVQTNTLFNHNGNNVDLDYEMAQLAKNQLYYDAVKERLNGHLNSLRTVITEGR
ncbi:flagellar basal body rod protein FlgB [Bacillus horti]|uniref:Flagellar basal body rod protein FlgB n=1 Tax=Caldalkalibacillus horti TaxID=77523 RepID=A0ABT9VUZ9_9BACI|nr:flagellar basal body rod protein FlgB [Bacillus horti]MDQ0164657.1 flagellar basal-body rod protein FlgB [Bacillus horti]